MYLNRSLSIKLSNAIATQLLRYYLNGSDFPNHLYEISTNLFEDPFDQREIIRFFENVADQIIRKIQESAIEESGISFKENELTQIFNELLISIAVPISIDFLNLDEIDHTVVTEEFQKLRPVIATSLTPKYKAIFERLFMQLVRCLTETIAALPSFENSFIKESISLLKNSFHNIENIVSTVSSIERQRISIINKYDSSQKSQEFLRYESDYRLLILRKLDRLELFGADIRPEAQRNLLNDAFVSLNIQHGSEDQVKLYSFESVLNHLNRNNSRILIRGSAGGGKTTLLRWAAIRAAELGSEKYYKALDNGTNIIANIHDDGEEPPQRIIDEIDAQINEWRNRIPFLILLRNCQDGRLPSPVHFPEQIGKDFGRPPEEWISNILKKGRGLVLIDGVDEVPIMNRQEIREELSAIISSYPNNYYIITSRPEAVPKGWLNSLGFLEAEVSPMSVHDTTKFIIRWHEAVKREICRRGKSPEGLEALASNLIEKLRTEATISPLATNPLLCAMICALHHYRFGKLPENLRSLCEALCEMLLHRRELESGLDVAKFPHPWPDLTYEHKRYVVQMIAYYMVLNEKSTLTTSEALLQVQEALKHFPDRDESEANILLQALIERSGILRQVRPDTESDPGTIDFLHNTFKEFLAGERFAIKNEVDFLAERYLNDLGWKRLALFAVAAKSESFPSKFIQKILSSLDSIEDDQIRRNHELFCLQCRSVALHLDRDLNRNLEVLLTEVFPPKSVEDGELIATLGEIAVPFLKKRAKCSAQEAAANIRALRLINNSEARKLIGAYIDDEREMVIQELSQWINPLLIPAIQKLIMRGEVIPEGIREQITDLVPLTQLSNVKKLNLSHIPLSDMKSLSALTELSSLNISHTKVKNIEFISDNISLEHLDLSHTNVYDLNPLKSLTKIKELILSKSEIRDLRPISYAQQLEILDLSDTRIKDISPISNITSLKYFYIDRTLVSDISPLCSNINIEYLSMEDTEVFDLSPLANLRSLIDLNIYGTLVFNLNPLEKLEKLENLILAKLR